MANLQIIFLLIFCVGYVLCPDSSSNFKNKDSTSSISSLDEQTDLKINDVVGLELYVETTEGGRATRDISHPPLYGTVDIYLVHSHDLFLRDTIDAKGHQGVKGDTSKKFNHREMK